MEDIPKQIDMTFQIRINPSGYVTNWLYTLFRKKWLGVAKLKARGKASRQNLNFEAFDAKFY